MSVRVFKRKRARNGKTRTDRTYSVEFTDPRTGRAVRQPIVNHLGVKVTDRSVAHKLALEAFERMEREAAGLLLPQREVEAAQKPLADHLADFIADHKARGHNRQYVWDLHARTSVLIEACGWGRVCDVAPESFLAWRQQNRDKSAKTLNDYLAAAVSLLNWMKRKRLIPHNPLEHVGKVRGEATFKRRVLTPDEFGRLLAVSGRRRPLYLFAVLTGLRRSTVRGLRWRDVLLDGDSSRVTVPGRLQKNRTELVVPLRADLADALRELRENPAAVRPASDLKRAAEPPSVECDSAPSMGPEEGPTDDRVFAHLLPHWGVDFLRADLKRAGLPYVTDQGVYDWHAIRHTAATWAAATGEGGAVVQHFMGHKTASQTARYVHAAHLPTRSLVERLPRFDEGESGTGNGTVLGVKSGPTASDAVATESDASVHKCKRVSQLDASRLSLTHPLPSAPDGIRTPTKSALAVARAVSGTGIGTADALDDVLLAELIAAWPRMSYAARLSAVALARASRIGEAG